MSCAASAGTEATSHGSPTTYCTRDFALERCGRARKGHTPVDAVMWFYGAKTAGMLVLFGCEMQWLLVRSISIELYFPLTQEARGLRGAFRE